LPAQSPVDRAPVGCGWRPRWCGSGLGWHRPRLETGPGGVVPSARFDQPRHRR
jgi:hypothetical protein